MSAADMRNKLHELGVDLNQGQSNTRGSNVSIFPFTDNIRYYSLPHD